jgi:hypothetical protein
MSQPLAQTLDTPDVEREGGVTFRENLRPHDSLVSPVLRYIRREIERGTDDETWLGEQFQYLLVRLLRSEARVTALPERLDCVRAATRRARATARGPPISCARTHEELSLVQSRRPLDRRRITSCACSGSSTARHRRASRQLRAAGPHLLNSTTRGQRDRCAGRHDATVALASRGRARHVLARRRLAAGSPD